MDARATSAFSGAGHEHGRKRPEADAPYAMAAQPRHDTSLTPQLVMSFPHSPIRASPPNHQW
jgi:hypothetical protein